MNLRKLLAGAGIGLGLTAAANRLLAARAEPLRPPLGRATETYRWRGFDVAYTVAGEQDAPDLLLLHGINAAGSSAEFARVVDALAEEYHVIAPDLPGFGLSDRPPLMYSASLYTTFVSDFLRDRTDDPIVVASGLTGAYAAAVAEEQATADDPATGDDTDGDAAGRMAELVLICPTADTIPGRRTWLRSLFRSPLVGTTLFNLVASKPSIRYFEADHGLYDMTNADGEYLEYRWQLTHQPGARFAPASFLSGFLDPDLDLQTTLADLSVPVTLVWGRAGDMLPVAEGRTIAEAADARLVVFDEAILLPHYEHPDEFVAVVRGADPGDKTAVPEVDPDGEPTAETETDADAVDAD